MVSRITLRIGLAGTILLGGLLISLLLEEWREQEIQLPLKPVQLPVPGDNPSHFTWFIHVTDLHLTKFTDHNNRLARFEQFLGETLPAIDPKFVVVTGDLCHAKIDHQGFTAQYEEEWKLYRAALEKFGRFDPNFWVDLRGNHDCFDTGLKIAPGFASGNPFYRFSVTGLFSQQAHTSFTHSLDAQSSYSVVTLDACPVVGARSPLNFFGMLNRKELDQLEETLHDRRNHNMTIVAGHYPLSLIRSETSSTGRTLMDLLREHATFYLCGHLHQAFGTFLQTRHSPSLLELELGDFKENDVYRVMAIDHDMFSFVDQRQNEWPVVLITNPKDARYLSASEPIERIAFSSHIRFLAFSTVPVTYASVWVDGAVVWEGPIEPNDKHMYRVPWKPQSYRQGLHHLEVRVTDQLGRQRVHTEDFSVDGTTKPFVNYSRWILQGPIQQIITWGFVVADVCVIIFLLSLIPLRSPPEEPHQPGRLSSLVYFFRLQCWYLRQATVLYWVLVSVWSGMMVLPWFMGKISSPEHYGCVFLWGIVHFYAEGNKQLVVDSFQTMDTHLYAGFQMVNFLSTLLFFWSFAGSVSVPRLEGQTRRRRALIGLVMYVAALYQARICYRNIRLLLRVYGNISVVFSPIVAWYNAYAILHIVYLLCFFVYRAVVVPTLCRKPGNKSS